MEPINQIFFELLETKNQLSLAQQKIQQLLHQQTNVYAHNLVFELQAKLTVAQQQLESQENQIESQEQTIRELNEEIRKTLTDNHYLKERNDFLSASLYDQLTTVKTFEAIQAVQETKPQPLLNGISEDALLASKAEEQREKTKTIAMKLKELQNSIPSALVVEEDEDESPLDLRFFVGRLSNNTNEKLLKAYFSQFGTIADVFMPREGSTHRGFAFITFSKLLDDKPLKTGGHVIDNKRVHIDISCAKDDGEPTKTLLISGLIRNSSDSTLQEHFETFGEIFHIARFRERDGKFSRYAFVHYRQSQSVDKVLAVRNHVIDGFKVDCRRAHGFSLEGKKERQAHGFSWEGKRERRAQSTPPSSIKPSKHVAEVAKLMVSNLTKRTTFKMLKNHFSKFGNVLDAYVPTVYGSGESKGFGYVVMSADSAFDFKGHIIDGACVKVSYDNEFHSKFAPTTTVLVSAGPSIIARIPEQEIRKFFAQFGRVVSVRKFIDPQTKKHSHYVFVEFTSTNAVDKVLEHIGYYIGGQLVTVTRSRFPPHMQ